MDADPCSEGVAESEGLLDTVPLCVTPSESVGEADENKETLGAVLVLGFEVKDDAEDVVGSSFVPETVGDIVDDWALDTLGAELVDQAGDALALTLELRERSADEDGNPD